MVLSRSSIADSRDEIFALAMSSSLFKNSFCTLSGVEARVLAFFGGGFWATFGRVEGGREPAEGAEEKEHVWLENVIAGTISGADAGGEDVAIGGAETGGQEDRTVTSESIKDTSADDLFLLMGGAGKTCDGWVGVVMLARGERRA